MSDLLYTVFTDIEPEYEKEFERWQSEEHCPLLMTLPGYQSVLRYRSMDRAHYYTNFWHITSQADFDNPERGRFAATPWGKKLSPYRHRRIDFYIQDGGLEMNPPSAELSDALRYLLICQYTNRDDIKCKISSLFRHLELACDGDKTVLEVKLYHAYKEKGRDENYAFFYLPGTDTDKVRMWLLERLGGIKDKVSMELFEFHGRWLPTENKMEVQNAVFHDRLQ